MDSQLVAFCNSNQKYFDSDIFKKKFLGYLELVLKRRVNLIETQLVALEDDLLVVSSKEALDLSIRKPKFTMFQRLAAMLPILLPTLKETREFHTSIFLGDAPLDRSYSGIAMSSCSPSALLVPDAHYLMSFGYTTPLGIKCRSFEYSADRIGKVYWRGSLSGPFNLEKPMENQRFKFVYETINNPVMDARITRIPEYHQRSLTPYLASLGNMFSPPEPFINNLNYNYAVDIDGHANSWDAFFLKLAAGLPILKIESKFGFRQWYYDDLVDGYNFISILSDNMERRLADVLSASKVQLQSLSRAARSLVGRYPYNSVVKKYQAEVLEFCLRD
jgi:hypothetical protein